MPVTLSRRSRCPAMLTATTIAPDNDDYTQPGHLFRLMNDDQKEQLFSNIAAAVEGVPERICVRQLVHFYKADPDLCMRRGRKVEPYQCLRAGGCSCGSVSG